MSVYRTTLTNFEFLEIILLVILCYYSYFLLSREYSLFGIWLILSDMSTVWYLVKSTFTNCLYITHFLWIFTLVCYDHVRALRCELNSEKNKLITKMSNTKNILHILHEHTKLWIYIEHNIRFVSKATFIFMSSNLVFNVYLISLIFFRELPAMNRFFATMILMMQITGPLLTILPMILIVDSIYSIGKTIPQLQLNVNGCNSAHTKLKILSWLEQVNTDNRVVYSAGPLGGVTTQSLIQVRLML